MHQFKLNLTQEEVDALQRHADDMLLQPSTMIRAWIAQALLAGIKLHALPSIPRGEEKVRVHFTLPEKTIEQLGGKEQVVGKATRVVRDMLGLIHHPASALYPMLNHAQPSLTQAA